MHAFGSAYCSTHFPTNQSTDLDAHLSTYFRTNPAAIYATHVLTQRATKRATFVPTLFLTIRTTKCAANGNPINAANYMAYCPTQLAAIHFANSPAVYTALQPTIVPAVRQTNRPTIRYTIQATVRCSEFISILTAHIPTNATTISTADDAAFIWAD